jgi:hypothetical protein
MENLPGLCAWFIAHSSVAVKATSSCAANWVQSGTTEEAQLCRCGILLMLSELGLPLIGRQHSARDDVANLAALLRTLASGGCAPELTGSTDGRAAAYLGDTPDLALARLALLLEGQPEKAVMSCLKSMRWALSNMG